MAGKKSRSAPAKRQNPLYSATVADIASAAMDGVKAIRKLINVEDFIFDTAYGLTTATNTAVVTQLNNIAQGDGQSGRTGNSILMSKIHRTEVVSTAVSVAIVREILFYDKQQIADTVPGWADVLETQVPSSLYNKLNKGRFQIIEDKFYTLASAAKPVTSLRNTKMLNKHAIYNGTGAGDIQKMGLYKLIVTDGVCAVAGSYRLHYHDN